MPTNKKARRQGGQQLHQRGLRKNPTLYAFSLYAHCRACQWSRRSFQPGLGDLCQKPGHTQRACVWGGSNDAL